MQLLQSWKESLAVLWPRQLFIFLKESLQLLVSTCVTWLRKFWWLPLAFVLVPLFLVLISRAFMPDAGGPSEGFERLGYVLLVGGIIIFITSILVIGSMVWTPFLILYFSIKRQTLKKYPLFTAHTLWFMGIMATTIILQALMRHTWNPRDYFLITLIYTSPRLCISTFFIYMPFLLFIFALLNTQATLRDAFRSAVHMFKAILYNLPFLIIMTGIFSLINFALEYGFHLTGVQKESNWASLFGCIAVIILWLFCALLYMCMLSKIYARYEQRLQ